MIRSDRRGNELKDKITLKVAQRGRGNLHQPKFPMSNLMKADFYMNYMDNNLPKRATDL